MGIWESLAFFGRWISAGITALAGLSLLILAGYAAMAGARGAAHDWAALGLFAATGMFFLGAWAGMRGRPLILLRLPWALLAATGVYLKWVLLETEGAGGAMLILALPGLALSLAARKGQWLEY